MKHKLIGKIFSLALAAMTAVCFTACGGGGGSSDKGDSADPNKVNIKIWCQHTQSGFFSDIEKQFETDNPTINLIIESQPESVLGSSLDATMATDAAPDIVATYGGLVASTLVKSGRLVNIDSIIKPLEENLADGAKTNKQDGNGSYYTAPLHGFASPVIFYNKTMFEAMKTSNKLSSAQKAAVKVPETYAELNALSDACAAYGVEAITAGFSTWHLPHFMQAMHTRTMSVEAYAKMLDKQADPNPFDNDEFENGFRLLRRYYDDGVLAKGVTGYSVDSADMLFYNDAAAMRMGVSLDYDSLNENAMFDIGAFYLPAESDNPDAPKATAVYSDVLGINSRSKNADACKTFISFVMRADVQAKLADYSLFPSRIDADVSGKLSTTLQGLFDELSNGSNDFYQSWSYSGIDIQLLEAGKTVLNSSVANLETSYDQARSRIVEYFSTAKNA